MAYYNQPGPDSALAPAAIWLDTPARMAGHVQRFVLHLQQAQSQMFQHLGSDTQVASQEAGPASTAAGMVGLQMAYVADEFTRLAQFYNQVLSDLFSAQSQWTKELEASAAALLGSTLSDAQQPAPAWPALWAPAGVFQAAQATWTEMSKLMLDAIHHDLQAEEPVPAAVEQKPLSARAGRGSRGSARN